mgnify:CR=1 FL=1
MAMLVRDTVRLTNHRAAVSQIIFCHNAPHVMCVTLRLLSDKLPSLLLSTISLVPSLSFFTLVPHVPRFSSLVLSKPSSRVRSHLSKR